MRPDEVLPAVIGQFLSAIEARDSDAAGRCFTQDAAYHLVVPRPPVVGAPAISAVFAKLFSETTAVRWDIVNHAVAGNLVFLERVDRFCYGEDEASIECLGVFELTGDLISAVRDYADHETWRQRKELVTAQ